jgi:MFS family permease
MLSSSTIEALYRLPADGSHGMHFDTPQAATGTTPDDSTPWWRLLSRYHWFVLVVAVLGWSFDTMDQQMFNLARRPALTELMTRSVTETPSASSVPPSKEQIDWATTLSTSIFMIGWAVGGLIFGILGDKIGRARTMVLTILLYSIFTGLSALSTGFWDFSLYRFLTGLGVGGEFAVGVALVAEVIPERARAPALGWVQAFSAVGNITAALITVSLGALEKTGSVPFGLSPWRVMFLIGALPALLAVVIRAGLKEPERWRSVARQSEEEGAGVAVAPKLGSIVELFGDPTLRRNTIVGMLLAFSGVVGLWGIGFFSFDLFRVAFRQILESQGVSGGELEGRLTSYTGYISFFQNSGAFLGVYAFARITQKIGRKPTFAIMFILAMLSTAFTFWYIGRIGGVATAYAMVFVMGFCQIALFGGYAIYFPELFPTRLRSTGTSFCYNVGRLVAAVGPLFLGYLTSVAFKWTERYGADWPMRSACVTMCLIFLVGLVALAFAPETKDQPLPE